MTKLSAAAPRVLVVLATCWALHGCVAAVGTGAAVGASVAVDRRTTGTYIDDEIIELKALDLLRKDAQLWEQAHINVTSYNNVVLLTGEAPAEALRTRAAERVRGIAKVRQVHNEIALAAPSSMLARSSDTWLTGKVKTALLESGIESATRIKVVTESGTVFLLGLVSRAEADMATDIARKVGGVRKVVRVFEYTN